MTHPLLDLPVHPSAAVFPMLADDELAELAEDIKANGLIHPIVLDNEGQIVDGRNRYVACRIADVAPTFVTLEHGDVLGFVISENVNRRHMGSGALAMAITKAVRDQEKKKSTGGRVSASQLRHMIGGGSKFINMASLVYQFAPNLVANVIGGASLKDAHEIAVENKRIAEDARKKLGRLRRTHPELAERVEAGTLALADALAIGETFDQKRRLIAEADALERVIVLGREEIESRLPTSLSDAESLAAEQFGSVAAVGIAETELRAGDVMDEVVAAIDVDELERHELRLRRLRIEERLIDMVRGNDARELSLDLTIEEARQLAQTLGLVLRWVAAAYRAADTLSQGGRLEVVE